MKYLKRWLIKLIADDIRKGGEIAKALDEKTVQNLRQGRYQGIVFEPSQTITVTGSSTHSNR
jgi:hypothetical protein